MDQVQDFLDRAVGVADGLDLLTRGARTITASTRQTPAARLPLALIMLDRVREAVDALADLEAVLAAAIDEQGEEESN